MRSIAAMVPMALSLSLILTVSKLTIVDGAPCCLCGECYAEPERANVIIFGGTTCTDYVVQLASQYEANTPDCARMSSQYYGRCCTTGNLSPLSAADTPNNPCGHIERVNNGPPCELCPGGSYPSKPSTRTSVSGVTNGATCADLFCMGRKGYISAQMCYPMQDFMSIPCGCPTKTIQSVNSNSANSVVKGPPQIIPIVKNPGKSQHQGGAQFTVPGMH